MCQEGVCFRRVCVSAGCVCQQMCLGTGQTLMLRIRSIPKTKTDSILKGWSSDIAFVRTCISGAITRSKALGKGIEPSELREAVWEASKGAPPRYLCKYVRALPSLYFCNTLAGTRNAPTSGRRFSCASCCS